jgi:hypothetical protein
MARVFSSFTGIAATSAGPDMDLWATAVGFHEHTTWVELSDAPTIGVPLAWFPRLLKATPAQREAVEISPFGLHLGRA